MTENCEYFLHSRDGNNFYFRHKDYPKSSMQGFTLTYAKPGYVFLSGDMGCLCWHRHGPEYDYGFPGKNTGIDYFAEKVKLANSDQQVYDWKCERAIIDIKEFFASEDPDDFDQVELDDMLECQSWDDYYPEIGKFKMREDFEEHFPDYDCSEISFGEDWQEGFVSLYKMVQSVSDLVLEAVKIQSNIE